jgi:hypothetical protein
MRGVSCGRSGRIVSIDRDVGRVTVSFGDGEQARRSFSDVEKKVTALAVEQPAPSQVGSRRLGCSTCRGVSVKAHT